MMDRTGPEGLRAACYHESAHAIAFELLVGGAATVSISCTRDDDTVTYAGTCSLPGRATGNAAMVVALIGGVVEVLAAPWSQSMTHERALQEMAARVSALDAELLPRPFSRHDLLAAEEFARAHWSAIAERAEREIAKHAGGGAPAARAPIVVPSAVEAFDADRDLARLAALDAETEGVRLYDGDDLSPAWRQRESFLTAIVQMPDGRRAQRAAALREARRAAIAALYA